MFCNTTPSSTVIKLGSVSSKQCTQLLAMMLANREKAFDGHKEDVFYCMEGCYGGGGYIGLSGEQVRYEVMKAINHQQSKGE